MNSSRWAESPRNRPAQPRRQRAGLGGGGDRFSEIGATSGHAAETGTARAARLARWLLPIGLLITAVLLFLPVMTRSTPSQRLAYSDFLDRVNTGHVTAVTINNLGAVTGDLDVGGKFTSQIPTAITNNTGDLQQTLLAHHVKITGKQASNSSVLSVVLSFLPLLLIIGLFVWSGRAARRSLSAGIGGFGRSRAKITDAQRPTTRFSDVAGYDGAKQEITEVVDYLRAPERYAKAGAVGPRGVLMVGPSGTGKTLLARAVAGEADVPFLSISGSGFVELFVGVGASRAGTCSPKPGSDLPRSSSSTRSTPSVAAVAAQAASPRIVSRGRR